MRLLPAIFRFRRAGLANADDFQIGQCGFDLVPDVFAEVFSRGVGQAFHRIEQLMVELVDEGRDSLLDVAVVHEITLGGIDLTCDDDFDFEGVPMQSPTLVPLRESGQPVSGIKTEGFT